MKKNIFVILMILGLAGAVSAEDRKYELRTWTWKDGKKTVDGIFSGVYTNKGNGVLCVTLKTADGKRAGGPMIKMLSEEDQAYIKAILESAEKEQDVSALPPVTPR